MTHSQTNFDAPSGVLQNPPVSKCSADPLNSLRGCDGDATGGELFTIPETKSPRLLWLERHHLTIGFNFESGMHVARQGMKPIGYGPTPDDALVAAAKSLNIPLWNES